MKELELNSDQKTKVAYLNEKTSETFQDLTLILIMPVLAQFNPNNPWTSMKELKLNSDQKAKVI